jgi:hypothetical protein
LAAGEMSRLFPHLWDTKKAAERWLAKNPPEAYRDIIRVSGVLNNYRPRGQTPPPSDSLQASDFDHSRASFFSPSVS